MKISFVETSLFMKGLSTSDVHAHTKLDIEGHGGSTDLGIVVYDIRIVADELSSRFFSSGRMTHV